MFWGSIDNKQQQRKSLDNNSNLYLLYRYDLIKNNNSHNHINALKSKKFIYDSMKNKNIAETFFISQIMLESYNVMKVG